LLFHLLHVPLLHVACLFAFAHNVGRRRARSIIIARLACLLQLQIARFLSVCFVGADLIFTEDRFGGGFRKGKVLVVVGLLKNVGVEFALLRFEGVVLADPVVDNFLRGFVLPVCAGRKLRSRQVSVHLNGRLFHIAAAKDTGLQVLELAVFGVQVVANYLGAFLLDGLHLRIFPVDVLSH
jgi:hypothetical protein